MHSKFVDNPEAAPPPPPPIADGVPIIAPRVAAVREAIAPAPAAGPPAIIPATAPPAATRELNICAGDMLLDPIGIETPVCAEYVPILLSLPRVPAESETDMDPSSLFSAYRAFIMLQPITAAGGILTTPIKGRYT